MTTATMTIERASQGVPVFETAHWLLRLPLAAVILQQGFSKAPLSAAEAASYDLPVMLWAMAAIGEIGAGLLLLAGGVMQNWLGHLATRIAGFGIAAIVLGVLIVAYAAPPLEILLYNQFHVLLLMLGAFFALRGNQA
ncbi:MAG: hypothetical protein AAF677_05915 [Pseudomonadota bacterium]